MTKPRFGTLHADCRGQQGARVIVAQAIDDQLRQPRELLGLDAGGEHHRDRVGQQPPRNERERLCRRAIEPLCIVDHAQQRLVVRRPGQQVERGQSDQGSLRCGAGAKTERRAEGLALRDRKALEAIQHRRAQLLQRGEGQLDLRLHADGPGDAKPGGGADGVLDERRLANAGLAAHHQHAAATAAHVAQQSIQHVTFAPTADQQQRPFPRR